MHERSGQNYDFHIFGGEQLRRFFIHVHRSDVIDSRIDVNH